MSRSRILNNVVGRQLLNLVLAALLVLTTLVIIPSVANAEEEALPDEPVVTETTTTTAAENHVVTETTTTLAEEPVVEETTSTTLAEEPAADEEPVVTETTTTLAEEPAAEEEPVVTETTTTLAEEPVVEETTTTTVAEEPAAELLVDNAVEEEHEEEEAPTYKITFVKRVCPSYGAIRANQHKNWDIIEHAEPLGVKIGTTNVTAAVEDAAHPGCSPLSGWNFSMGTEIDASSGPLSQVADPFPVGIVTQASTPVLDNNGDPTGANVAGAVTVEVTQEQLDAAALSRNGSLSVSEGTTSGGGAVVPAGFGFGILRCGFDNRHGDNVEWVFFSKNGVDFANHITCYAYNVALPQPDFEIDKDAVDIDGVPYIDGDVAKVGETINYEVTVTNTGNVDFTDLVIEDPGLDAPGLTCAWAGAPGGLAAGTDVTCTGSHDTTVDDGIAGNYYNISTATTDEWEIQKDDDELVPLNFTYTITFAKRVCESYDDILKNFNNPDNLVEAAEPLGGGQVTWRNVNVADEEASTDCLPLSGWNFSIGNGFATPTPPGTLSQVTGNFGTTIVTEASTPLLDEFGQDTGDSLAGAVTIELSDEQVATAADDLSLWVSEGLNGSDGAVIPEGFGFGILRCGEDNRNGDNAEFITYPSLRGGAVPSAGILSEHERVRLPKTHIFCYAYNVAPPVPDLEIEKDAVDIDGIAYVDGDIAKIGQTINYEVVVTNTGTVELTDVVITDPGLDAPGLTCAWPNGDGVLAVGDGSSATLDDGDTVICTGSHVATEADAIAGQFDNVSDAESDEWELFKSDDETVEVEGDPQIEVTKIVDKPIIVAKDIVEFTIEVTNNGDLTLNDLTLDDVMTWDVGEFEDLATCEIPTDTTLAPGDSTLAQCTVELDTTTHGDGVVNTVIATATPSVGDDVSDSAFVPVAIIPPSPSFLSAVCISEPVLGFGFSLDEPLLEWKTTDWGPTFDPTTDTLELRVWSNDQDPTVDAPAIVYEVPWDSDLLGQEPYASVPGAPTADRIQFDGSDGYIFWPGYDNTGWLGPENGLQGIVYPGFEWRPTAYQFAFNPETDVITVGYPPATVDCVPGGALKIDKLAGPLGTAAGSADFVDAYERPADETEVTWQITLTNLTDYSLFNVDLGDDVSPSCVTAFEAVVQKNADGNFMTPAEELVFTCDLVVGAETVFNVADAGGVDLWGSVLIRVSDSAGTSTGLIIQALGNIGDTVWNDENENGVQDNGEKGISGVTVRMTLDDDSTLDTVTDSSGNYLFDQLPPGTYTVTMLMNTLPALDDGDWMLTTAASFTIGLADGESFLDADFGVVVALDTLPDTGIDTDTILIIAISLTLLGGTAILATRRKDEGEEWSAAA